MYICHDDLHCFDAFIVVLCDSSTDCFWCAMCTVNDLFNIVSCKSALSHDGQNTILPFQSSEWWSPSRPNSPIFSNSRFNGPENMFGSIFNDALSESGKSPIPDKGNGVPTARDHSSSITLSILSLPFADTDTLHWLLTVLHYLDKSIKTYFKYCTFKKTCPHLRTVDLLAKLYFSYAGNAGSRESWAKKMEQWHAFGAYEQLQHQLTQFVCCYSERNYISLLFLLTHPLYYQVLGEKAAWEIEILLRLLQADSSPPQCQSSHSLIERLECDPHTRPAFITASLISSVCFPPQHPPASRWCTLHTQPSIQ